jgi:hypothetical protein
VRASAGKFFLRSAHRCDNAQASSPSRCIRLAMIMLKVVAVHSRTGHSFSKDTVESIELVAGHGVRGDAHFGVTVKHRSRAAKDPRQPNLRQVHLLHEELFEELEESGFDLLPGQMGENITTRGIDLLQLSPGAQLRIGDHAVVRITGLRNPCGQIEKFKAGLLAAVLGRASDGTLIRKAGVMSVVERGGVVRAGDAISILHVPSQRSALQPV